MFEMRKYDLLLRLCEENFSALEPTCLGGLATLAVHVCLRGSAAPTKELVNKF